MKLNCIIVDDEPGALLVLENYISKLNYVSLAGRFQNAIEAFHFLRDNKVDILLLDINMPEIDGFGLLDMVAGRPAVIFTTACSDHALKAFEYDAIDYLQKPIRFERFVSALEKARKWCEVGQGEPANIDHIELKVDGYSRQVIFSDIYYIEGLGNYIRIHTTAGTIMSLATMTEVEHKLPRKEFIRVHKSYIVNASKIKRSNNGEILINDTLLPVGNTYKKYVHEFISSLNNGQQEL